MTVWGIVKLTKSSSIDPQDTGSARREPAMLGIKNGRQPQLDNTLASVGWLSVHATGDSAWRIEDMTELLGQLARCGWRITTQPAIR